MNICVFYISGFRDLSIYVTYTCHQERYSLKVTGLKVILLPRWQVCITDIHCWNMLYLIYFIKRFILKISTDNTTKQDTKHQTKHWCECCTKNIAWGVKSRRSYSTAQSRAKWRFWDSTSVLYFTTAQAKALL